MPVVLTRPVASDESAAFRATGHWADEVSPLSPDDDRPALVDREGTSTYGELTAASGVLAASLRNFGVTSGDAVVVVTGNDRPSVTACLAAWRLGAVAVLVHRSSGPGDVSFACDATSPAVVLLGPGAESLDPAAGSGRPVHRIRDLTSQSATELPPYIAIDPDSPRLVLFTSGTTSTPKGVVHTANTMRASAANFAAMMDFGADDRFFLVSPLASMAGVMQVLQLAPDLGAVAVLEDQWHDERTLDFLLLTGGTFYGGTDHALGRLLDGARRRGVGVPLRAVSVGGTMLRQDILEDAEVNFGVRVLRVYGSSEAPSSTSGAPGEPREVRLADDGRPAPGVELQLDGTSQELLVRGPHVFRGYLDPADNLGAFDDDGWFHTGDAAELVDGRLRVVGRLKEIANRNGKKLSLAEVEETFRAVTAVAECAAFAVPDATTGEHVALAVRLENGQTLDVTTTFDAMLAAGLAKWKLPEVVVRVDSPLPMTATGKVKRRDLSEDGGEVLWRADRLRMAAD